MIGGIGRRRASASGLLPVEAIASDALRLRGGGLRAVLECPTLAFGIKGELEQRALIDAWTALLNSLTHPIQIVIRTRRLDGTRVAQIQGLTASRLDALRDSYGHLLSTLAEQRAIVDRGYYLVVPWDPPRVRGRSARTEGIDALEQRVCWLSEALRRLDLEARRLSGHELATLLRESLDPGVVRQPLGNEDPLTSLAGLIAPAAVREHPGGLEVGERRTRTLAVVRYPSHLPAGWLADIAAFDGDLDVAVHIAPAASLMAVSFLERRVAELSSTIRASEERGARTDAYRRIALTDALELRDQLAQGSARLFDTTLAFTLWADDAPELEARTRGLEALLGARLVHTRRLLFRMCDGLRTTLPLGRTEAAPSRVLSTAALAASFPFAGSDARGRSGLLYGVNRTTKSPVVLDRFSLENHNAVVFATSGAGKSYLVKVELARAQLGGVRCLVVDPEGEYASLLGALGATVTAVRPGTASGLNVFALADSAAGTLSTRIATITTLIALIAAPLGAEQRAAVEEAVAFAYARAGFVDGGPIARLAPPRLEAVRDRLSGRASLEGVVRILDRYVDGPSAWLFGHADADLAPDAQSVVYVLAGLPEESRAAAMFLVLDRIWTGLRAAAQPTLVVVDEAWWLMRHPDTAAFLFRLVKTARKRRAGLTLVTQDVSDVLSTADGEAVISNAALQILMKQAPQAMPRLAELFRLTPAEQSFLISAQRGEALLVAQGRRIPLSVIASDEEARLIEGRAQASR